MTHLCFVICLSCHCCLIFCIISLSVFLLVGSLCIFVVYAMDKVSGVTVYCTSVSVSSLMEEISFGHVFLILSLLSTPSSTGLVCPQRVFQVSIDQWSVLLLAFCNLKYMIESFKSFGILLILKK